VVEHLCSPLELRPLGWAWGASHSAGQGLEERATPLRQRETGDGACGSAPFP
jgi:hypothetical protein